MQKKMCCEHCLEHFLLVLKKEWSMCIVVSTYVAHMVLIENHSKLR